MQRFDDRLSLLLYVTRQIRYGIYLESRHFSSSDSLYFVLHCVYIACSEYLFFHQSRHCQDDKLVCQIISGTKFGFVKNIYVMEKSNNCADIPKMKQLSSKTTFHLIDMWQWHCGDMAPAAAGYCSCCPPVSGSQSEARVEVSLTNERPGLCCDVATLCGHQSDPDTALGDHSEECLLCH